MFDNTRKIGLKVTKIPKLPKKITSILKNSKNVLDVGCGNGWLTNYVDKKKYAGITYSVSEKKFLNEKGYKAILLDLENEQLPFKNNTFDCIFASHIIEHFEKHTLIKVMNELKRVLKTEGVIIVTTPTDYGFGFYGEWTHVRPYNHGSLPDMLNDFEYTNVDWCYPSICSMPKIIQRYGRFFIFFLRPVPKLNPYREVISWGYKN
jgi:SAM-dependent methyltransferase